jgi:hypothetical protein
MEPKELDLSSEHIVPPAAMVQRARAAYAMVAPVPDRPSWPRASQKRVACERTLAVALAAQMRRAKDETAMGRYASGSPALGMTAPFASRHRALAATPERIEAGGLAMAFASSAARAGLALMKSAMRRPFQP